MTVKELKKLLDGVDNNLEVKPYVKDLGSRIQFWYFAIGSSDIKEDGLYIELL